jgi:hypothetical protein
MAVNESEETMAGNNRPQVRPLHRRNGSWCAEVVWPYATASHVGSFKSESQVQEWIVQHSNEYFRKCSRQ